jgi:hypothetical protein
MDAGTGWSLSEPQVSPDTHSYVPTHRDARASYVPRRPERRTATNRYDLFDIEHSTTRASVCATRVLSSRRLTKGCHGSHADPSETFTEWLQHRSPPHLTQTLTTHWAFNVGAG